MASVWKRLQRVNKRAAKFQYTASYHRVDIELTPKWKPNKLSIVWTRRSRRVVTEPLEWEPSLKDPLKGSVIFAVPENQTAAVTLFRDARTNELEDKDWTFVLEDVSPSGKRRRLASCPVNLRRHASLMPAQRSLRVTLDPAGRRLRAARIHLTLHCVLLREGNATDEDMQSLASLLSVNNNSDIAVLEDLEEDDCTLSEHSTRQMLDLRQQMEEMTQSLTNSDIAATPNSVQSLNFDNSRTPTAPMTPESTTPTTPKPKETNDRTEPELKISETFNTPRTRPEYLSNLTKLAMKTDVPRYTSTPKTTTLTYEPKVDGLKGVEFKPKMIAKRNLKPLELKTNLNNINLDTNDNEKDLDDDKTPTAGERLLALRGLDKTPVQELLDWCGGVTREYRSCRVTDLAHSFRSGLAFCAIIHHYRPDLIDFSGLQAEEFEQNVRTALEASARLGIAQVLTVKDVCSDNGPDKLAIMTYLFQLRAYFTGNELQVEQLGNDETESSYLVGRHDTDESLPPELFSREVSTRRSRNMGERQRPGCPESRPSQELSPDKSPAIKDVRDMLLHSKNLLGKMLSPARERERPSAKWFADSEPVPARPEKLMTRKELTDPFGSDEEEEVPATGEGEVKQPEPAPENPPEIQPEPAKPEPEVKENKTETKPAAELPKPTPQLLSRHDELKERARQLLEAAKIEERQREMEIEGREGREEDGQKKSVSEDERQAVLRERARRLIADARNGGGGRKCSPSSPAVEIISKQSVMDEFVAAGGVEQLGSAGSSPGSGKSLNNDISDPHSDSGALAALVGRLSPDCREQNESGSYLASELEALEREQRAVDETAARLEVQLRKVMDKGDDAREEDRLMSQWFNLVNKKNALLRRQMQLNILEQEEDLSRRCELLARELRLSLGVEEWRKTPGQKRRERLLLQELLAAVNERDRLVQEMDEQEKAIAQDDEIERNLSNVEIQRKNNCILQ
ncbi:unnamed protein product [Danaus chrysippus]|uniref:(African queen) hypothetical protein n=1 Tax=Danaus chrysippus TaxID=151541 RepID=A0A8J2QVK7_9NEOP|nr:unnamed protein product [Danaus chrysippus]